MKLPDENEITPAVDRACKELEPVYDAYIILGTWVDEEGNTRYSNRQEGNAFALHGLLVSACMEYEKVEADDD
jgi:hypothetical protein